MNEAETRAEHIVRARVTGPRLAKMLRLREHIEWAASHGSLAEVHAILHGLPADQWHHVGE